MPFTNNSRNKLKNPLTQSLYYNDSFSSSVKPNTPLPIETEDSVSILTEDNNILLTEGDE